MTLKTLNFGNDFLTNKINIKKMEEELIDVKLALEATSAGILESMRELLAGKLTRFNDFIVELAGTETLYDDGSVTSTLGAQIIGLSWACRNTQENPYPATYESLEDLRLQLQKLAHEELRMVPSISEMTADTQDLVWQHGYTYMYYIILMVLLCDIEPMSELNIMGVLGVGKDFSNIVYKFKN